MNFMTIVSFRDCPNSAAQGTMTAFESVFVRRCGAQVLRVHNRWRQRVARRLGRGYPSWLSRPLPKTDVLLVCGMGPGDVWALDTWRDWRRRARRVVFYTVDCYPWQDRWFQDDFAAHGVDLLLVAFRDSVERLRPKVGCRVEWLPFAVEAGLFSGACVRRDCWVFSFGRVWQPHRESLEHEARRRGKAMVVAGPQELKGADAQDRHRRWLADQLGRSVFSLCYAVPDTSPDRAAGISPVTTRYFEVMAAGAIPVGTRPGPEFEELFPYPDAMVEVPLDRDAIVPALDELERRPDRMETMRRRNVEHVLKDHTWDRRAERLLELVSMN